MKSMLVATLAMILAAPSAQAGVRLAVSVGPPRRPHPVRVVRPVVVRAPAFRVVMGPRVVVAPGFGRLAVEVTPDKARVFIDDHDEGKGDAAVTLRAGAHTVKAVLPDGRRVSRTVRIEPGRLTTVRLDLT